MIRQKKQDADAGSRWEGKDTDYFLRGFRRDRSRKSAKTARVVEKRLGKIEVLDRPEDKIPLNIKLAAKTEAGSQEIRLIDVVAGYAPQSFKTAPISLEIRQGNRIAILGNNGSGKSTIIKTITGELAPLSGTVEIGSGLRFGNLLQEHETLPRDLTILDFFMQKTGLDESMAFSELSKFSFHEWQIRQQIGVMSPGGRARLLLAVFAAQSVNVLVLDEPTNHLDIEALDALETMLEQYTGTVLLVSHDRYFLEKAKIGTVFVVEKGVLSKAGSLESYLAQFL